MDAAAWAKTLLGALGHDADVPAAPEPVVDWAGCGAMALTGRPAGPPLVAAGAAVALRGALLALQSLAPEAALPDVRLLGERAALAGLSRLGDISCGRATRLLATTDGHVAISLARPADEELVPALVESDGAVGWDPVQAWAAEHTAAEVRDRAVLLGLAVGVLGETQPDPVPWRISGPGATHPMPRRPVVVDLSSLWAGPLCASLLGALGCDVLKVEDPRRPDGARRGNEAFFSLLNGGARVVPVELGSTSMRDLLLRADVVIEGSRPRALQQVGIIAEEHVDRGTTWVSITGHGRDDGHRIGYGDDAAVAGGLVARDEAGPVFVGDAVADPLTGVHAALAAWSSLLDGGGRLVDVALAKVAAAAASLSPQQGSAARQDGEWCVDTSIGIVRVAEPWARPA